MIECLKNLSGDSEMTVRVVYEWKTDDRYIQQAREGGISRMDRYENKT